MDGNPVNEPDKSAAPKDILQGWPPAALEQDKKTVFWMGGVMDCFSTVLSLFNKADLSPTKDDDGWEVPFSDLSEFMYLGSGAQGIVFRSIWKGEMVAVKKLRERSEANIKHLRKLNHENIVRFRGVSINGPIPCIIMEYCQYGPLFNFLHSGASISAKQTFDWAKEIALGMAYLHSNQIIHRDLKSPNILIADHLTVKVSDFGTSREWDNVSTIMSFTGTVAWMAPEVIRHEPCSERVDVWSYGVVLWELLTQEIPYKNMETHAIMWGVGTDTLSLPIPASCPENFQILLLQCWRRIPRNRPPFQLIAANLALSGETFESYVPSTPLTPFASPSFKIIAASLEFTDDLITQGDCFSAAQITWRNEIKEALKFIVRPSPKSEVALPPCALRKDELRHAKDVRQVYEQQLNRANELYLEVCSVRLQLEQREREVTEREKALKACRCGLRKNLKYLQRQTSSSSDNFKFVPQAERRRKNKSAGPSQVVVNFEKGHKAVAQAVAQENINSVIKDVSFPCVDTNDNMSTVKIKPPVILKETTIKMKDVVLEQNGNFVKKSGKKMTINDNYIPDVAQV